MSNISQIKLLSSPDIGQKAAGEEWLFHTLNERKIDIQDWGKGPYKSFKHLLEEISSGETQLGLIDQKLYRICTVLRIDVLYREPNKPELKLFEVEQIFSDGRRRVRDTPFAIWEKLKSGEDLDIAVSRAMLEELQIKGNLNAELISQEIIEEPPLDFPGLPSLLKSIDYRIYLTDQQFCQNGYEEKQPDKTTYFRWKDPNK